MYDDDKMISVCVVQGEENFITRIADVFENRLEIPKVDHSKEYKGFNRDKLYYNRLDRPSLREGYLGVWKWSVSQNHKEPDKDWVLSEFQKDFIPIEIIDNFINYTKDEMILLLQEGMPLHLCDHPRLLLFRNGSREQGVLCSSCKLEKTDSGVRVKNDVYGLPCYDIDKSNFIRTQWTRDVRELCLYRSFHLPQPNGYLLVRSPADAVKMLLKDRLTWRFVSDNGVKRKDFASLRNLIAALPVSSLIEDIAAHCHCSESNAKMYWDSFLADLDQYIHSDDIETQVIQGLLRENESLRERLHDEWRRANQQELEKEEDTYRQRKFELETQQSALIKERESLEGNFIEFQSNQQSERDRLGNEIKEIKECLNNAQEEAKRYEALGREGLQKVRDKLSLARKEAAEFLADLALFGSPGESTASMSPMSAHQTMVTRFLSGRTPEEWETVSSTEDELEELKENLRQAGVGKEYLSELAAYLYGAFKSKVPLLLAGPQGTFISNAVSCTLAGRYAAVLDCYGEWSPAMLDTVINGNDEVIIVKYPFQNRWIDYLIPELDATGKMWIFVHPYAADLPLEPSSLYQYVMPLVLDIFIDHPADIEGMLCSRRGKKFNETSRATNNTAMVGPLKKISRNHYLEMQIKQIMAVSRGLPYIGNESFLIWGCVLLPLSIALGRKDIFLESIQSDSSLSQQDRVFLENAIGDIR